MHPTTLKIHNQTYQVEFSPLAECFGVNWSDSLWNPGQSDIVLGWAESGNDKPTLLLSLPDSGKDEAKATEQIPQKLKTNTAYGFSGDAFLSLKFNPQKLVYWSVFLQDVAELLFREGHDTSLPMGFTAVLESVSAETSVISTDGKRSMANEFTTQKLNLAGFFFVEPDHISRESDLARKISELIRKFPIGGPVSGLTFSEINGDVFFLEPETAFNAAELQVYKLF